MSETAGERRVVSALVADVAGSTAIGGELRIDSAPGHGTIVAGLVPVEVNR